MCSVNGCDRDSMYKEKDLCQKHYFRLMRNGTTDLKKVKKHRLSNPKGYQLLYKPEHPLAQKSGYVYEHRLVVYSLHGEKLPDCELCGANCDWQIYKTHIDHIDHDVTNNDIENLRVLCNKCNTRRDFPSMCELEWCSSITYKDKTDTAHGWSRDYRVTVSGRTIKRRIENGWSVENALLTPSKTIKTRMAGRSARTQKIHL